MCTHIDMHRIASSHHKKLLEEGNRLPSQPSAKFTKRFVSQAPAKMF